MKYWWAIRKWIWLYNALSTIQAQQVPVIYNSCPISSLYALRFWAVCDLHNLCDSSVAKYMYMHITQLCSNKLWCFSFNMPGRQCYQRKKSSWWRLPSRQCSPLPVLNGRPARLIGRPPIQKNGNLFSLKKKSFVGPWNESLTVRVKSIPLLPRRLVEYVYKQ